MLSNHVWSFAGPEERADINSTFLQPLGTHEASDRFVRGAFYAQNLPDPKDERDAVAALLSVIRNVGLPATDKFHPTEMFEFVPGTEEILGGRRQ